LKSTQGTGARLGEIAPLSAADVKTDELTNIHSIVITEDLEQGAPPKDLRFPSWSAGPAFPV
jgi:hypothetical protein